MPALAPPPPSPPSKVPSYVLWGVGGASLVVGIVFGASALAAKSDYDDHPTYDKADTVHTRTVVADVALGLAVLSGIGGTLFYFVEDPAGPAPAQARAKAQRLGARRFEVQPLFGPHTQGGAVTLRF